MELLRSYDVRVCHQEAEAVDGMVESVDTGKTMPFHTAGDLWAALCRPAPPGRPQVNSLEEHEP
jgi:hypothetical protein